MKIKYLFVVSLVVVILFLVACQPAEKNDGEKTKGTGGDSALAGLATQSEMANCKKNKVCTANWNSCTQEKGCESTYKSCKIGCGKETEQTKRKACLKNCSTSYNACRVDCFDQAIADTKVAKAGQHPEKCDGVDNDKDGWTDVITSDGKVFTAVCKTNESCGKFGESCTATSYCMETPDHSKGALCVCVQGYQSCGEGGCQTNVLSDNNNCGNCGVTCESNKVCEEGECVTKATVAENCVDGIDNDGDVAIDCADSDCALAAICKKLCIPGATGKITCTLEGTVVYFAVPEYQKEDCTTFLNISWLAKKECGYTFQENTSALCVNNIGCCGFSLVSSSCDGNVLTNVTFNPCTNQKKTNTLDCSKQLGKNDKSQSCASKGSNYASCYDTCIPKQETYHCTNRTWIDDQLYVYQATCNSDGLGYNMSFTPFYGTSCPSGTVCSRVDGSEGLCLSTS